MIPFRFNSCFCCSKTFAEIILWVSLVGNLLEACQNYRLCGSIIHLVLLFTNFIAITACAFGLYGLHLNQPMYLMAYIIYAALFLFIWCVVAILSFFLPEFCKTAPVWDYHDSKLIQCTCTDPLLSASLLYVRLRAVITIVFQIFSVIIVRSYYEQVMLKDIGLAHVNDGTRTVNTLPMDNAPSPQPSAPPAEYTEKTNVLPTTPPTY